MYSYFPTFYITKRTLKFARKNLFNFLNSKYSKRFSKLALNSKFGMVLNLSHYRI